MKVVESLCRIGWREFFGKKSAWELTADQHILWPSDGLCSFSL